MKAASFFSGIGGFDLGFERAGIEVILQCEIDASCRELLGKKFSALVLEDVRAISAAFRRIRKGKTGSLDYAKWQRLFELLGTASVWCGGFPCQDLSIAGSRAGLVGERSGLWYAFRRIIALFRPTWVVLENVPGLLSSHGGRDLAAVLGGLEKLGYRWAYRVLDAQFFGLAQRRERVFIVASLGDFRCAEVLFERESVCWDSPPSREEGKDAAEASRGGAADCGIPSVAPTLLSGVNETGGTRPPGSTVDNCDGLIPAVAVAFKPSHFTRGKDGAPSECTPPLTADADKGDQDPIVNAFAGVRRLSPIECARLQGFPDSWLETEYANAAQAHAHQILHELWKTAYEKSREGWRPGIASSLFTPEILLAGVHGGWISWEVAARCAASARSLSCENAWPENFVRLLWLHAERGSSPYRRESFEQLAGELGGSLSQLPLEEAQAAAHLQRSELWSSAQAEWPLRYAFAKSETRASALGFSDSTRYRMLGNAVAAPVAEWIGKRLVAAAKTLEGKT